MRDRGLFDVPPPGRSFEPPKLFLRRVLERGVQMTGNARVPRVLFLQTDDDPFSRIIFHRTLADYRCNRIAVSLAQRRLPDESEEPSGFRAAYRHPDVVFLGGRPTEGELDLDETVLQRAKVVVAWGDVVDRLFEYYVGRNGNVRHGIGLIKGSIEPVRSNSDVMRFAGCGFPVYRITTPTYCSNGRVQAALPLELFRDDLTRPVRRIGESIPFEERSRVLRDASANRFEPIDDGRTSLEQDLSVVAPLLPLSWPTEPPSNPKRDNEETLVAMGGMPYEFDSPKGISLLAYLVELSNVVRPRVVLVSPGKGDAEQFLAGFYDASRHLCCVPDHLDIFTQGVPFDPNKLRRADVIIMAGGNSLPRKFIYAGYDIPEILRESVANGAVLAGWSDGAINMYETGWSGGFSPNPAKDFTGMGFLDGSMCPHRAVKERFETFCAAIAAGEIPEGIAIPDECLVRYSNKRPVDVRVVYGSVPFVDVARVRSDGRGGVQIATVKPRQLEEIGRYSDTDWNEKVQLARQPMSLSDRAALHGIAAS